MIQDTKARLRPSWYLLGPAFVAAIAYVDPGNVAANVSAGAQFGFLLVWVIVVANAMACLVQYLSAKLGLVTGLSLPEAVGSRMRRPSRLAYWLQAELVAMATDLAEVMGGAIALHLLFDLPLLAGGVITGIVSLLLLLVKDWRGQRTFERVITGLLLIIAIGFLTSLFVAPPPVGEAAAGLVPKFAGTESVLLAAAMLGATVMPHAVYLHSGLARDRHGHPDAGARRRMLLRVTRWDVGLAMLVAGAVNLSMVLVAATNLQGREGTDSIEGAHAAVQDTLGARRRIAVRDRSARVRAGVVVGWRLRGRDDHAGPVAQVHPAVAAPPGHVDPRVADSGHRARSQPGAGVVAGGAVVRHSVRADTPDPADQRCPTDGRRHKPPRDHRSWVDSGRVD